MANIATITNNIISALSGTTSQVLLGDATLTDFKLDSLTDVNVPTPGDGDVLKWNASTSLWEASDNAGITGSGVAGQVAYFTGATTQGGSNNLFWDSANSRLGIGTNVPDNRLQVVTNGTKSTIAIGNQLSGTYPQLLLYGGLNKYNWSVGAQYNVNNAFEITPSTAIDGTTFSTPAITIFSNGNFGVNRTTDNGLRFQVTGDGYFSGNLGINTSTQISPAGYGYAKWVGISGGTSGDNSMALDLRGSRTIAGGFADINFWHQSTSNRAYIQARRGATDAEILLSFVSSGGSGMTLDASGNLGLGTSSPSTKLHVAAATVSGTIDRAVIIANGSASGNGSGSEIYLGWNPPATNAGGGVTIGASYAGAGTNMLFSTPSAISSAPTVKMTLDGSGNLGLGVTPSAWGSVSKAIQMGAFASVFGSSSNFGGLATNRYNDNANNRYIGTGASALYEQGNGIHYWYNAPSGTAGNVISYTQAMTLDASGNLAVGIATASSRLHVDAAAGAAHIRISEAGTTRGFIGGAQGMVTGFNGYFMVRGEAGLIVTANGNSADMIIRPTTGNVQIGTTAADAGFKLDVNGTMRVSGASTFNGLGTFSNNLNVSHASNNAFITITRPSNTYGSGLYLYTGATPNWLIGTAWGETSSNFVLYNVGTSTQSFKVDYSTNAATFSSSVSAGSFIPSGATIPTNGMYLPAADSIALSTTSTQRFRITSGGNIVINSDSADNGMKFQVIGTGYISSTLGVGTLPTYKLDVLTDGNNGIRTTSSAGQQLYLGNSAGTGVVGTLNNYSLGIITNSSIRATIDTNGNFGIGVSPSYKLHVSNNANSPLYIGATNTTAGNASSAGLLLTSNTASGSAEYQKRSSTATNYKTLFSNDLAIYNTTAGDITLLNDHINGKIEFAAGGASTPQITIDSAGRLLIGTISSSTYKLDVVGDARVSNILNVAGVVTLGDLAGTGTRIVVADTNGVLSTQATSTYLTSLTGEATSSGGGATTVTLTNSAVIGKVLTGLNVSAAVITSNDSILSAFGKIQGQIDALQGGTVYKGGWNANTNSPAITSGTGTSGHYYVVTTAGSTTIDGISSWAVGDWIIFNGTVWEKIVNVDAVTSVNGQTGAVSLTTSNINEGTNLYYTDARARAAISLTTTGSSGAATYSSGVLNIPTYTLSGLGGAASSRQLTINGTAYDLSADRSWSVGTVTSVGELTIGTSGTDITSTVSNGTSAAVITLNVPTASASNRGALSSADWSTFNSKEPAITAGTTAQYWRGDKSWQTLNTTAVTEGTNLYYTDTRARAAISLTTTGTSGTASYSSGVLNIPNYSLTITYNNNADASYQMLWGSGNAIYGTAGITCNPFTDSLTLTGSLISGGISVNGYGRMYGGDFWHSGIANNGTRTPTLKLGRFTDSDTSAYTIYADDTNGDILEFYSERYTADFRITRGSDSGVRNAVRINSDNGGSVIDVYTGDGSTLGAKIQSNGDARFAYDVVAYYSFSDARLKNNIATIQNPLQKVMAMRGVTYEWNEGYKAGKKEIGLIAQEVMEIIPEVVAEKERVDGSKFLSVDYEHLTGLLIEAVKELKKEVDELKSR